MKSNSNEVSTIFHPRKCQTPIVLHGEERAKEEPSTSPQKIIDHAGTTIYKIVLLT